jgi:hypothetical protein
MIYVKYAFMVPVSLVLTLIAMILAPILPLFARIKDGPFDNGGGYGPGPWLPKWLGWFQTPDNNLWGDSTFQHLHGHTYWAKVLWLWRNPAYSYGIEYMSGFTPAVWSGDREIKDNDNAKAGKLLVKAGGLFQFVFITPIGFGRCFMVNLGWNIRALVDPNATVKQRYEATFVFSPRISGFR